jgi:hypothetical protein
VSGFLEQHRQEVDAQPPGIEARLFNEFRAEHNISPTTFHTKLRQFRKEKGIPRRHKQNSNYISNDAKKLLSAELAKSGKKLEDFMI